MRCRSGGICTGPRSGVRHRNSCRLSCSAAAIPHGDVQAQGLMIDAGVGSKWRTLRVAMPARRASAIPQITPSRISMERPVLLRSAIRIAVRAAATESKFSKAQVASLRPTLASERTRYARTGCSRVRMVRHPARAESMGLPRRSVGCISRATGTRSPLGGHSFAPRHGQ